MRRLNKKPNYWPFRKNVQKTLFYINKGTKTEKTEIAFSIVWFMFLVKCRTFSKYYRARNSW